MAILARLRALLVIVGTLVAFQNVFLSFTIETTGYEKADLGFYAVDGDGIRNVTTQEQQYLVPNNDAVHRQMHVIDTTGPRKTGVPNKETELHTVKSALPSVVSTPAAEHHQNKTLVILIGNLRGGETAWKSLYDNVLDVNNADLALMIGETRPAYQNASLFDRAAFHWTFDEYDDWADALDLINGTGWREIVVPLMHPNSPVLGGAKIRKFHGSGGVIFMIRWWLSNKLRELKLTERYDRFIITRSDHYYLCRHNISQLEVGRLWIPAGSDCGGVTDRHLVVSSEHVMEALNVLPLLLTQPEEYKNLLRIRSGNPEKILYKSWKLQKLKRHIRRFDRMMFTCGETGDMTRWQELGELVPEGVRLKYVDEYNSSLVTCHKD